MNEAVSPSYQGSRRNDSLVRLRVCGSQALAGLAPATPPV
jgi:hypothetical protein